MIKTGTVSTNRKARQLYNLEKDFEVGIALKGDEVKSLRMGACDLKDAYVEIMNGQAYLVEAHIRPYKGAREPSAPRRRRKLLLHKYQIRRLAGRLSQGGYTCIPLEIYFNEKGIAKVKIAIAHGKKKFEHKDTIIERTRDRETRQATGRER
ncbi:MAG TPA: SsrA-binding protein SmpB [Caldisericia bacterium]|nr:SsrA-binding protein SmpB [Caldisericia bacterium]HPF48641.1 SsrA-binding protein SmpB [Caldisericia bacterium]HPI83699.1 SsrA-binding protein SmpB [Caldisericia bacterium]HPQ93096.1 SsrA-binding protein SmpB [Caldisericia bacterium]HRV75071.1 SsrA-binding protein SmpB [Caldisericia bacterium]